MVVQSVSGQGWQQAFAAALEQADVEVFLKVADLLRQCGLLDSQTLCRPAHMTFFVDRDEITQLLEIHK